MKLEVGDASGGAEGASGPRPPAPDDRVLPLTRVVSAFVLPVLTAAFVILFLFPGSTGKLWGWTIASEMSAMFMGAGYLAGASFFARATWARQWHRLGPGIVATTAFATLLGVATLLHWDEFNHDHVSFWAWLALYTATPLLLPLLWLRNRRHDPGRPEPGERLVPARLRLVVGCLGLTQLAFALALFVRPSLFVEHWPWPLAVLSARSLAGFATFPALAYAAFLFERRWSALRWPLDTAILGLALVGLAGVRGVSELRSGGPLWGIGLVATLVFLGWVRLSMDRQPPVGE